MTKLLSVLAVSAMVLAGSVSAVVACGSGHGSYTLPKDKPIVYDRTFMPKDKREVHNEFVSSFRTFMESASADLKANVIDEAQYKERVMAFLTEADQNATFRVLMTVGDENLCGARIEIPVPPVPTDVEIKKSFGKFYIWVPGKNPKGQVQKGILDHILF